MKRIAVSLLPFPVWIGAASFLLAILLAAAARSAAAMPVLDEPSLAGSLVFAPEPAPPVLASPPLHFSVPFEQAGEARSHTVRLMLAPSGGPRLAAPPRAKGNLSSSLRMAADSVSDRTGRRLEFRRGDLILNISDTLYWRIDEHEITYRIGF